MALSASVLGASGFAGGELLRYLAGHPGIAVVAAGAERSAGEMLASVHPHLSTLDPAQLTPTRQAAATPADVCFSCLPSGALAPLLDDVQAELIVDLSDEHRAASGWTYGLTEFARDEVETSRRIANPGCYPTAVLLALVPLAREGLVDGPVVVDALSGVSGAGRKEEDAYTHAVIDSSARAYGTTDHRHVPEMEASLAAFAGSNANVSFTPHLVPMTRGLLATVRARLTRTIGDKDALESLQDAYAAEPFVEVIPDWPSTKAVAGTNRVQVTARVDGRNGWAIACAALDNLGKGAAGQAIQNANRALGLPEPTGLEGLGVWP